MNPVFLKFHLTVIRLFPKCFAQTIIGVSLCEKKKKKANSQPVKKVDPPYYRIIFHPLYLTIAYIVSVGSTSVISALGWCKIGAYSIETILEIFPGLAVCCVILSLNAGQRQGVSS